MKRWLPLASVLVGMTALPGPALSVDNTYARIALHAGQRSYKGPWCPSEGSYHDPNSMGISCLNYDTSFPILTASDVYVVAAAVDSISGASFGIDYCGNGAAEIFGWTSCFDDQVTFDGEGGPWPSPGSGIRLTGSSCELGRYLGSHGRHVILGAFYLYAYSEDQFSVTANKATPEPEMVFYDCSGGELDQAGRYDTLQLGWLGGCIAFGSGFGYAPS